MQIIRNKVIQFDDQTKYCSPLVIVKKPGVRSVWWIISLTWTRKLLLNSIGRRTRTNSCRRIAGAGFISTIDLRQSFWQVKLQEESQKYTGFQCEFGCFSYKKICMGLKNASFTMQRLIDRLRGAHRFAGALLDDVIIYDNDFQLHLDHVRDIFDRLRSGA